MKDPEIVGKTERAVIAQLQAEERRDSRRVEIARPLLARPSDPQYKEEVTTISCSFI